MIGYQRTILCDDQSLRSTSKPLWHLTHLGDLGLEHLECYEVFESVSTWVRLLRQEMTRAKGSHWTSKRWKVVAALDETLFEPVLVGVFIVQRRALGTVLSRHSLTLLGRTQTSSSPPLTGILKMHLQDQQYRLDRMNHDNLASGYAAHAICNDTLGRLRPSLLQRLLASVQDHRRPSHLAPALATAGPCFFSTHGRNCP